MTNNQQHTSGDLRRAPVGTGDHRQPPAGLPQDNPEVTSVLSNSLPVIDSPASTAVDPELPETTGGLRQSPATSGGSHEETFVPLEENLVSEQLENGTNDAAGDRNASGGRRRAPASSSRFYAEVPEATAALPSHAESYTLSREDISELLDQRQLSRSERTVREWMSSGKIRAQKVSTDQTNMWLANETSALRFIEGIARAERIGIVVRKDGKTSAPTADLIEETEIELPIEDKVKEKTSSDSEMQISPSEMDVRILNASLTAENTQLKERLIEKTVEVSFARDQVKEANKVAERSSREAEQFKMLLASKDAQFQPLLESATSAINRNASQTHTPTKPLFDEAEIDNEATNQMAQ